MNAIIACTQIEIMAMYQERVTLLVGKPRHEIETILAAAEQLLTADKFSHQVAAQINRAACLRVLGKLKS